MTIAFLITSLIVCVSPGTGVLYTLGTGLSRGFRASVVAAVGCTLGICPHIAAAILGLAAALHASAMVFQAFKYIGVAYLLVHGLEHAARARRVEGRAADGGAFRSSGDRDGCRDPSSQPETLHFLHGLPAAVHRRERRASAAGDARLERRVHGDDFRGFRRLRPVRRLDP